MDLESFKVDEIRLWRIKLEYREPFRTSFGVEKCKETIIIGLKSGDYYGYGELVAIREPSYSYETLDTALSIFKEYFIPLVLKKELNPYVFYNETSWIRGHPMAKATFEMALWDLHAKYLEKPLYEVIGGSRKKVEVGVSIGIQDSVDRLIRRIEEYLEEGYRRIKIKIKPGWDFEVLEKVRREFPDIPLTVDANAAYTKEDIPRLTNIDKYNLLYLEQPLYYWDIYYHSILQRKISTPICLDESLQNSLVTKAAIKMGATKIINLKPGRVGGIIESLHINEIGLKNNTPMWIGGMLETGIGRSFNVSIATLDNVKYPSDISESRRYYMKDIITEEWIMENGFMEPRKEAGIGVEIDWRYFYKKVLKEWVFR